MKLVNLLDRAIFYDAPDRGDPVDRRETLEIPDLQGLEYWEGDGASFYIQHPPLLKSPGAVIILLKDTITAHQRKFNPARPRPIGSTFVYERMEVRASPPTIHNNSHQMVMVFLCGNCHHELFPGQSITEVGTTCIYIGTRLQGVLYVEDSVIVEVGNDGKGYNILFTWYKNGEFFIES